MFRASVFQNIVENSLAMRLVVVLALPRDILDPGLMYPQLHV